MLLRPKGSKLDGGAAIPSPPQRIPLPHGSALLMDLATNRRFLHEIRPQGAPGEIGPRISLTFRHIGTFWDPSSGAVWGTGAKSATRPNAHERQDPESERLEAERMLHLFRDENQDPSFDAQEAYRAGFTVLNFKTLLAE